MKTLMFENRFTLKYEDDDLEGLLAIAVDDGDITTAERDKILQYIARNEFFVSINHVTVFEMVDHDNITPDIDEDEFGLGLPDTFET